MMMARCRSDVAAQIKARVTAKDVLESYGYAVDRHGKCRCPFHDEKTASFQCYPGNRGWYCFGCHKGGDVIKLVMELEHLPFAAAVQHLDYRFGVGAISDRPAPEDPAAAQRARERKKQREEYAANQARFAELVRQGYTGWRLDWLDYWLSEHKDWR